MKKVEKNPKKIRDKNVAFARHYAAFVAHVRVLKQQGVKVITPREVMQWMDNEGRGYANTYRISGEACRQGVLRAAGNTQNRIFIIVNRELTL